MTKNNPAVLLISPEPWLGNYVSKHHYAIALSRLGYTVYFLNPPIGDAAQRYALDYLDGVNVVSGPPVARGLRFYPRFLRNWRERRWLSKFEAFIGCPISVVWLFENSRFYDMRFAGWRLKIYHQVDINQDFHTVVAASTADICFCTTDYIKERLIVRNQYTYKIHHSVSVPTKSDVLTSSQTAYFNRNGINVAYVGNLDISYLDVPLFSQVIDEHPHIRFHLVGPFTEGGALRQACKNARNVIWWGQVESSRISAILNRCDLLLVIYLAEQYRAQLASPHKLMEYLASGKTVVSTYTDEYKDKHQLLVMVEDSKDLNDAFEKVVNDLTFYNSPELQAIRMEFANNHSYEKQLNRIFDLLQKRFPDYDFPTMNLNHAA